MSSSRERQQSSSQFPDDLRRTPRVLKRRPGCLSVVVTPRSKCWRAHALWGAYLPTASGVEQVEKRQCRLLLTGSSGRHLSERVHVHCGVGRGEELLYAFMFDCTASSTGWSEWRDGWVMRARPCRVTSWYSRHNWVFNRHARVRRPVSAMMTASRSSSFSAAGRCVFDCWAALFVFVFVWGRGCGVCGALNGRSFLGWKVAGGLATRQLRCIGRRGGVWW